jgi:filamentous hemagglutinin family protein
MKLARSPVALPSFLALVLGLTPAAAWAQIIPDTSLPVNSIVAPNGNTFTIDGGTQAGGNLFHSFQDFSLPTGTEAFFNNSLDVQNIFSRVTGGKISNIDGLIRANGGASLFLLNPAGIVFGPNARLNIGGSFFGTTANSIQFADGVEFSATNLTGTPLLTINVPIGLQFGQNPGGISVQGSGHRLHGDLFTPLDRSNNPIGLQVGAGNTLALIGGEIDFSSGVVAVNGGGHLEVSSVSAGQVQLNPMEQGWIGDYSRVQQFNDIHLTQQSLLDASGSGGSIQIQGRNISLSEGSLVLLQNLGLQPSRGITIHATESLNLTGNTSDGKLGSSIKIENLGTGQTGDITISAAQLSLQDGGKITSRTFTPAPSANVTVNVAGLIDVNGSAPGDLSIDSSISTVTFSATNAGELTVSSGNMRFLNGGNISSVTVGSGQAGTIHVNAEDSIDIVGNASISLSPSAINSLTFSASGNANNTFVNTSRLAIRDGGFLGSLTVAAGAAGSVTVNASESVEIGGRTPGSIAPSRIASTAEILDPANQEAFGFPAIPSGNAGSLTINTPSLRIADEAFVSVKTDGPGSAGDLQINANSIVLDDRGGITASTASGNGGDIRLNLQDSLLLRHGSTLSATAAGNGNGGNLSIDTPVLVGLENSDIIANAVQGNGGNIQITTQGIFGLQNRPQLTSESDITASSQFGVSGNITITNPEVDPSSGLVNFSQEVVDPSEQVISGCQWTADSEFVATRRSGIPANPNRPLSSNRTWSDVRDLSEFRGETVEAASVPAQTPKPLVEATGWVVNEDGTVELVATASNPQSGNFGASECNPVRNGDRASAEMTPSPKTLRDTP